jgi:probable H4MPT-linked C1 transfer pathway protein
MNWLALDIGGANLKAADGLGFCQSVSFPLWKRPRRLAGALRALVAQSPPHDALAVTMTGELADCYSNKAAGVAAIVRAAVAAAGKRRVAVYTTAGQWLSPIEATRRPLEVAAANWHALASFAGRYAESEFALLIDIGSTTSDIIPLAEGRPIAEGRTDPERLALGELVYTGVVRSPLCAVVPVVPWRGGQCPTAQELFATTADVYVTLGDLAEDATADYTADGRPLTRRLARDRLAHSICADDSLFDEADARAVALAAQDAQLAKLGLAVCRVAERMPDPPERLIPSGQGEFLAVLL